MDARRTHSPFHALFLALAACATANSGCGGSVRSAPAFDEAGVDGGVGGIGAESSPVGTDDGGSGGVEPVCPTTVGASIPADGRCGSTLKQLVDLMAVAKLLDAGGGFSAGTPLAVDSTSVYFVMGATLMRVPIVGGPVSILADLPDAPAGFSQNIQPFVTSTAIVVNYSVANDLSSNVVAVPIQGGTPTVLTKSRGPVTGFDVAGNEVYFVDGDGTKAVPTGGGAVRLVTDQVTSGDANGLAVVGSTVFIADADAGTVVGIPAQGGPPSVLATNQTNASLPIACGSDVCWLTGVNAGFAVAGPGQIRRLAASGELTTISGAQYSAWSFAFDGTSFFETVSCDACPGLLVRVPSCGAPVPMTLAGAVAVDDECAYFTTIQPDPAPDGGAAMGIFSVVKSFATCCQRDGSCVYTTGSCPTPSDAGAD